jgi:hypothetical protein
MPTDREREYYRMGFRDGQKAALPDLPPIGRDPGRYYMEQATKPKRKLSAWNKFVKANSKKKIYQYANGKLKLKKMGIAFRKKRR